jgi:hypothetical protein
MRLALIATLSACATAPHVEPKGGPRGLRATEHVAAASLHEQRANQTTAPRERRPDVMMVAPETVPVPWTRSWEPGMEDERLAADHRARAARLLGDYEAACGQRSELEVRMSPLVKYGVGGWPTSNGVILYLAPEAGQPDKLLAELECHRAWMMLAPADMDDCPLDLPGLMVDAHGEEGGITVSISVRDPKLVDELHRRATVELESASRIRSASPH